MNGPPSETSDLVFDHDCAMFGASYFHILNSFKSRQLRAFIFSRLHQLGCYGLYNLVRSLQLKKTQPTIMLSPFLDHIEDMLDMVFITS